MTVSGPDPTPASDVSSALELLIGQFTQPLAFLRELVQNSLDAGSNRVDVDVHYDDEQKTAVVVVADTGEGMDREIIDRQLTRLFSSSKEGDFTKIGKFGIGFVSVFAVQPRAVVVDTARGGEAWRVIFHPDRTFDRVALEEMIEGTRVQVFVPMPRQKLEAFRRDCRETVVFWCRHCEVEIRYSGQAINQAFALMAPYEYRHVVPGTEVVVAPSADSRPFYGFYNRGLTLLEGREPTLPQVTFKIRSRYLEHTLTRDQVLQDQHFAKAMSIIRDVAFKKMPLHLFQALHEAPTPALWEAATVVLGWRDLPPQVRGIPVFTLLDGGRVSLKDLLRGESPCYLEESDDLARAASARGERVLRASGPADPQLSALRAAGLEVVPLAQRWFLPRVVPTPEALESLFGALRPLLGDLGFEDVHLVESVPGGLCACRLHSLERAQRLDDRQGVLLALQQDRSLLRHCAALARHDPGLAAFLLARGLALDLEAGPAASADLFVRAIHGRRQAPPPARPVDRSSRRRRR